MDMKTLQYMGTRVDEARAAMKLIEDRKKMLEVLDSGKLTEVRINNISGHDFRFGGNSQDQLFTFTANLIPAIRTLLQSEIVALEKRIAEL